MIMGTTKKVKRKNKRTLISFFLEEIHYRVLSKTRRFQTKKSLQKKALIGGVIPTLLIHFNGILTRLVG